VDWQPIATAPKDGTEILGYIPAGPGHLSDLVCTVWWDQAPSWRPDESDWETPWGFNSDELGPSHWLPHPATPTIT